MTLKTDIYVCIINNRIYILKMSPGYKYLAATLTLLVELNMYRRTFRPIVLMFTLYIVLITPSSSKGISYRTCKLVGCIITGLDVPLWLQEVRLQEFLECREINVLRLSAQITGRLYTPRIHPWYSFLL
jgi:hypothetical protein